MKLIRKLKAEIVVFVTFVLSRLYFLGNDIFNTDVWKWKARTYNFSNGVFNFDFGATLQKYHPGVTLMWIGTFAIKLFNALYETAFHEYSPDFSSLDFVFKLHFFQKLFVVLVIAFCIPLIFSLLRKLFDTHFALLVTVLLSLEPFYVALSRVYHLEGLLSTFILLAILEFYAFLQNSELKYLLFSSFFTACAVLTKTSALILLPFIGIAFFLYMFRDSDKKVSGNFWKHLFGKYSLWLLGVLLVFTLLWPALWVTPKEVFETLYRGVFSIGVEGGHSQLYFGNLVQDPGFGFYFVVILLRSSVILVPALIGFFAVFKKLPKDKKQFARYIGLFVIMYLLLIIFPSKKLDRYVLPALVSLVVLCSIFFDYLFRLKKIKYYLGILCVSLPLIICLLVVTPDYLSYFNPLFGGLKVGIRVIEPKWIIGQHQIQQFVNKLIKTSEFDPLPVTVNIDSLFEEELKSYLVIAFPEKYYTQIWPFVAKEGAIAVIKDLTPHAKKANYFIYPVWQDDSEKEDRFHLDYVDSIFLRGVEIFKIYENTSNN